MTLLGFGTTPICLRNERIGDWLELGYASTLTADVYQESFNLMEEDSHLNWWNELKFSIYKDQMTHIQIVWNLWARSSKNSGVPERVGGVTGSATPSSPSPSPPSTLSKSPPPSSSSWEVANSRGACRCHQWLALSSHTCKLQCHSVLNFLLSPCGTEDSSFVCRSTEHDIKNSIWS